MRSGGRRRGPGLSATESGYSLATV